MGGPASTPFLAAGRAEGWSGSTWNSSDSLPAFKCGVLDSAGPARATANPANKKDNREYHHGHPGLPGRPGPHDGDPGDHPGQLFHDPSGQLDHFHRLPTIHAGCGLSPRARLGSGRLHPGLRRAAAARRPGGDLLGRRRVFVFGLAVFALASLLVGARPGWWADRRAGAAGRRRGDRRALVALAADGELRRGPERPARSRYGATAGIGASLGLVIGGALADWVSWRAGFFVNVPIGAAMILARAPVPARDRRGPAAASTSSAPSPRPWVSARWCSGSSTRSRRTGRRRFGRLAGRRRVVLLGLCAERAPGGAADHAAAALRQPAAHRRLPRPVAVPGRDDRLLLLHDAVPAGRARVRPLPAGVRSSR